MYEYDFGDGWQHSVLLERVLLTEAERLYPSCIGGERTCPPEDVGGVHGYQDFLEAVMNPSHPEHQSKMSWARGSFDPERFDSPGVRFDDRGNAGSSPSPMNRQASRRGLSTAQLRQARSTRQERFHGPSS